MALADSAMQGIAAVAASARSRRSTSWPSMSGSCMSTRIRSGRRAARRLDAAGAVDRRCPAAGRGAAPAAPARSAGSPGCPRCRAAARAGSLRPALATGGDAGLRLGRAVRAPSAEPSAAAPRTRCPARRAVHLHGAAHALDQRLDDGQADAGALDALALQAQPVEGLEGVLQLRSLMPRPVSLTRSALPSTASASTSTWPPSRLYLTALVSRFSSTWRKRVGIGPHHGRARRGRSLTLCCRAWRPPAAASRRPAPQRHRLRVERISPPSRLDRSSTSLISDSRCWPAAWICSRRRLRVLGR